MAAGEHLTVGEFERLMDVWDKRQGVRFSAIDGRLSTIQHDMREVRNVVIKHEGKIASLETANNRAKKTSWTAVVAAIVLAVAEGARRFFTP